MRNDWEDWVVYDETSPSCLRWKVSIYSGKDQTRLLVASGDVAGHLNASGYWYITLDYTSYLVHLVIDRMFNGPTVDGLFVDHEDGNKSNNKQSNLRRVTRAVNQRNQKLFDSNTSGVVGVTRRQPYTGYWVWTAFYFDLDGVRRTKTYSIPKYGDDTAFQLACSWRADGISKLNTAGAGYTARHGTAKGELSSLA